MPISTNQQALRLAKRRQGATARDFAAAGIHRQVLTRLVASGHLQRVSRGVYRLSNQSITEHHALTVVAATIPHGTVTLLSALQFHQIGTQLPSQVWIALDRRARRPALKYPTLRIVRYTGAALTEGIDTHRIEGAAVRIYCAAKTIADCFKYRNKIGLEVALEALHEGWRARRFTLNELDRYARICRVQRVMRPYIEALVA